MSPDQLRSRHAHTYRGRLIRWTAAYVFLIGSGIVTIVWTPIVLPHYLGSEAIWTLGGVTILLAAAAMIGLWRRRLIWEKSCLLALGAATTMYAIIALWIAVERWPGQSLLFCLYASLSWIIADRIVWLGREQRREADRWGEVERIARRVAPHDPE